MKSHSGQQLDQITAHSILEQDERERETLKPHKDNILHHFAKLK